MTDSRHPYDVEVGSRLREKRLEAVFKQGDLSAALRVTRATVTRWEQGTRGLTVAMLLTIADALDMPASELLPEKHQLEQDPQLAAIVGTLRSRPDLIPTVEALLETLLQSDSDLLAATTAPLSP